MLAGAISHLQLLNRDRKNWETAIKDNTFSAYRAYAQRVSPPRTVYYARLARQQLLLRKNEFGTFLELLTYRNRDQPLRNWLIKTVREASSIEGVRLSTDFSGAFDKSDYKSIVRHTLELKRRDELPPDIDNDALLTHLEQTLKYKNIAQFHEVVDQEFLNRLHDLVGKVLTNVFSAALGEQIVLFVPQGQKSDSSLYIMYKIQQTNSLFSATNSGSPEETRQHYRGVDFRWAIHAHQNNDRPAVVEIDTNTTEFRANTSSPQTVFMPMAATNFIGLATSTLKAMGFPEVNVVNKPDHDAVAELTKRLLEEIREQAVDQLAEQFIEDFVIEHEAEITIVLERISFVMKQLGTPGVVDGLIGDIVGEGVISSIDLG